MASRRKPSVPRKKPSQRRSERTVDAILEAAAQVFASESYASGTTDRIAERAGVSVGTVYQYFPDKDAILSVLMRRHLEHVTSFLSDLVEQVRSSAMPLGVALQRILRAVAEEQESGGGLHRAVAAVGTIPADVVAYSETLHAGLLKQVRQLLEASPEVKVKNLPCASYLILTTVDLVVHEFLTHPPAALARKELLDELARMVMAYLTT